MDIRQGAEMICSKGCTRVTSLEGIWKKALELAESDQKISVELQKARDFSPWQVTEADFLCLCARAIIGTRYRYGLLEKSWADIERAFFYWDTGRIVNQPELVKTRALQLLDSPRKVDKVIGLAGWLNGREWPTVRAEVLSLIAKDKQGNPIVTDKLIRWFDRLPGAGRTTASSLARDLAIGSLKEDMWLRRLAEWLGYSADRNGVWQMALEIQAISSEKIGAIDVALRNWAKTQDWLAYVSAK